MTSALPGHSWGPVPARPLQADDEGAFEACAVLIEKEGLTRICDWDEERRVLTLYGRYRVWRNPDGLLQTASRTDPDSLWQDVPPEHAMRWTELPVYIPPRGASRPQMEDPVRRAVAWAMRRFKWAGASLASELLVRRVEPKTNGYPLGYRAGSVVNATFRRTLGEEEEFSLAHRVFFGKNLNIGQMAAVSWHRAALAHIRDTASHRLPLLAAVPVDEWSRPDVFAFSRWVGCSPGSDAGFSDLAQAEWSLSRSFMISAVLGTVPRLRQFHALDPGSLPRPFQRFLAQAIAYDERRRRVGIVDWEKITPQHQHDILRWTKEALLAFDRRKPLPWRDLDRDSPLRQHAWQLLRCAEWHSRNRGDLGHADASMERVLDIPQEKRTTWTASLDGPPLPHPWLASWRALRAAEDLSAELPVVPSKPVRLRL